MGDDMNNLALELINNSCKLIKSSEFLCEFRMSANNFTRNRKMGFIKIICFCLNFIRKSLQLELDNYMDLIDDTIENPITKQAFSKARQHISPKAFEKLFLMTSELMLLDNNMKDYKGYRIFAIDGTELLLSRSKELFLEYPPSRSTNIPRARVSTLCDVLNECIIHADIQNMSIDERTMALKHLEYYDNCSAKNGLFILDRGYPSRALIQAFGNKKYIMRLQKSFNTGIDNSQETDFDFSIPFDKTVLKFRVIKLMLPSGEIETLITNLERNEFGESEFMYLYSLRWGIETKYDILKNKLQIEDFSGKTKTSVLQDFYATIYLSNIATAVKYESDKIIATEDDSKFLKHTYSTNENILIGKLKNNLILIMLNDNPEMREVLLNKLIKRLSRCKVTNVPGRHFDRPTEAHKKKRSLLKKVL